METVQFFQKAFADSAKKLLDANAQADLYAEQLSRIKIAYIAKKLRGREFQASALLDDLNPGWCGHYEDVLFKFVGMCRTYPYDCSPVKIRENDPIVCISIDFMRDPEVLLKGKLKLTDKEKQILRQMKVFYDNPQSRSQWHEQHNKLRQLHDDLRYLKHNIAMVIQCEWCYNFSKLLDENFLTNGLKAQQPLF